MADQNKDIIEVQFREPVSVQGLLTGLWVRDR